MSWRLNGSILIAPANGRVNATGIVGFGGDGMGVVVRCVCKYMFLGHLEDWCNRTCGEIILLKFVMYLVL